MLSQCQLSVLQDNFWTWPVLQIHVELNLDSFLNSHSTSSDSCPLLLSHQIRYAVCSLPVFSLACVAGAWKYWAKEKTGAREGDTRGVRECLHRRPTKIVSTRILRVRIFPIGREAPEGKINCAGRENCQSIVHGQRSEDLTLHH